MISANDYAMKTIKQTDVNRQNQKITQMFSSGRMNVHELQISHSME